MDTLIVDYMLREVLDSRGVPTLEAEVELHNGVKASAIVPSGASTGSHEALEKRDGNPKFFLGKGVSTVISEACELIEDKIIGLDALDQKKFDRILLDIDGTSVQKSVLGANVTLGLSMAVARAAAESLAIPLYKHLGGVFASDLPIPLMNIINGGVHADNGLSIQEFMIIPHGFETFHEALRCGSEVYHTLKSILKDKGLSTNVGDEGGFAPNIQTADEAFILMSEAVIKAGYKLEKDVSFGIDAAASEFYDDKSKTYKIEEKHLTSDEIIDFYMQLADKYPLASIEDGLHEDDWAGWSKLTNMASAKGVQIVGDDLFTTNCFRIERGIEEKSATAVLIKPNQIGTVSETVDAIKLAHRHGLKTIISHRSGESEDTFIADLAVAFSSEQIKTGAPCRSERVAKYNRLLRIESDLFKDI